MGNLAGLLAAIAVSAMLLPVFYHVIQSGQNRQVMAAAGSEFQTLLAGVEKYASANQAQLASTIPVGGTTQVPLSTLISSDDLPPGFGSMNPFGQTWQVYFRQPESGQLEEIVDSVGGTTLGLPVLTGVVAMASGQAGFVPPDGVMASLNSSTAVGNMGQWRAPLSGRPNPGAGHFYGLVSAGATSQYNTDVLYRDSVPDHPEYNTMNADLNMGGNNIDAANTVAAGGADGVNNWPAGWARSGVTSGHDMYANGWIGAGLGNQLAAYINSGGDGHVDNHFDARQLEGGLGDQYGTNTGGMKLGEAYLYGDNANLAIRVPGSLVIQHPGTGWPADISFVNNITAQGQVYASNTVAIGTSANAYPGNPCTQNGSMAGQGDGSGVILSCVNGSWSGGQSFTSATTVGISTGTWYSNPTPRPMFVSTSCTDSPFSNGYMEELDAYVATAAGTSYQAGHSRIQEGGKDSNFSAAPFVSFVVPPEGSFVIFSYANFESSNFCNATLVN